MKKFLLLLVITGFVQTLRAQVSVTATAGNVGPTNYATLKQAFDQVNAFTHQGAITISITGNTTETAMAVLNAANYTSILIKPTGNFTISGNLPLATIIKLNGADNVTIDGAVSGNTPALTITNTSSDGDGMIWVASSSSSNGANNNTVRNCILTGSSPSNTWVALAQSSGTTFGGIAETANSNNTYQNNRVTGAYYGIALVGPSSGESNNQVLENIVGSTVPAAKIGFKGLFISNQTNPIVRQNTVSGVSGNQGSNTNVTSGITIVGATTGGEVSRNIVSDIRNTASLGWTAHGITLQSSSSNSGVRVVNNFIYDVSAVGWEFNLSDNGHGIGVLAGNGYEIYSNSVNLFTNQTEGNTAAIYIGTNVTSPGTLNIRNNIFANQQTVGEQFAIYSEKTIAAFSNINYNDYFSTDNVGFLGSVRNTLAQWQAATSMDANSVAINPGFVSNTDLHLGGGSFLNGTGVMIAGVTNDIDGDARTAPTDIGADDFTPPVCTGNSGGTVTATTTSLCASGSSVLNATGFAFGTGAAYQWEFSTDGTNFNPLAGQTNPFTAATGTITVTTHYRLRVTCNAGAPGYSNVVIVTVNNPTPTTTTPASRCGFGTVTLQATGTNLKWYDAATGGNQVGSGPSFTTPGIGATTTYYVSASTPGSNGNGGKPSTDGGNGGFDGTNTGLVFNAATDFTLLSVKMYPTSAGSITIRAVNSSGAQLPGASINVNFAAAAPGGIVVPLNFNIPAGNGHRLIIFANAGFISFWRDFSGNSFPYALGSVGSITGGYLSGSSTTYYYFYDWVYTTSCEGNRVPVTATITSPPAFTTFSATPPGPHCSGSVPVNLSVSSAAAYTYTWMPGSLVGPNHTVNPTSTTTYVVTATEPGGCVRKDSVTVAINPTPAPVVVTPASATICPNVPIRIIATGGHLSNQQAHSHTLDAIAPYSQGGTGGTVTLNTTYFSQGTGSVRVQNGNSSQVWVESPVIPMNNFTSAVLLFDHICATELNFDFGWVEYSTNGGSSWTTFPSSNYLGSGVLRNGVVSFDKGSYPDWGTQFTDGTSTPGPGPATSLWKSEAVNFNGVTLTNNMKIRFRVNGDVSLIYYGWLIDNIRITGTNRPITWTVSTGASLYSSTTPLTAYVPGTIRDTIWMMSSTPDVYNVTATSSGVGCNSSATSNITVANGSTLSAVLSSNATTVCQGDSVTFTVTVNNLGTGQGYKFYRNNILQVDQVSNTWTYLPSDGDIIHVVATIISSCLGNNPATSNNITINVQPAPTVNITGGTTVCNGSITTLTANTTGGISGYQWYNGGILIPGATSSTYDATLPGSYTVTVTGNQSLSCPKTSAPHVLTHPAYDITVIPAANGTITPSGTVSVACGDDQVFNINPNPGFGICDVLVDGVSMGVINTYTFNNVTAPHTITAVFCITGCPNPPQANAGANAAICSGQSYTLQGSLIDATAGTWSGGGGTFTPNNTTLNAVYTPSAAEVTAGTVTLTLTSNNPLGAPCVPSSSQVTITINPSPVVNVSGNLGLCAAGVTTTLLTADSTGTPTNITNFQWYNGATLVASGPAQGTYTANSASTYSVTVTGANGCTAADTVVITTFAAPVVAISGNPTFCTRSSTDLVAVASAGSGTLGPNSYQWKIGGSDIVGATTSVLTTGVAGSYTVVATNSNGCNTTSAPFVLNQDNTPLSGNYTIGMGLPTCTNYESFQIAINDLNTRGISGNVQFDVPGGYTEVAPTGGLSLGSATLNPSVGSFTITFSRIGGGANPLISAYPGGTALANSVIPDGIWNLKGVDNVTINSIDLVDNNTAGNSPMEYGYGIFKLNNNDGAQNNTIQNCVITLNKLNGSSGAGPMVEGSTGIRVVNATPTAATTALVPTVAAGTNSYNKFYGNTIQNVHHGIAIIGYDAPSSVLGDKGNDIGGSSDETGNTIINFGGASSTLPSNAIRIESQWDANISFNIINNNNGSGINHLGTLRGIITQAGNTGTPNASITINNNTISIKSDAVGSVATGIQNGIGSNTVAGSNTVTITNNDVTGSLALSTTSSGVWTGIVNSTNANVVNIINNNVHDVLASGTAAWIGISNTNSSSLASPVINFNNNKLLNCNIQTTGALTAISNAIGTTNAVTTLNMNGNLVSGNTKNGAGTIVWLMFGGPLTGVYNNNVVQNNVATATAAVTVNCMQAQGTGVGSGYVFNDNVIYNNSITGFTGSAAGTLYGFTNASGARNENIYNNIIRNLFITGTSTGIHTIRGINNNTNSSNEHMRIVANNQVDSLYTNSGSTAQITGIHSQVGYNIIIEKNRIHSLFPGQNGATASFAKGIVSQNSTSSTSIIKNNFISLDLSQAFSPASNSVLSGSNSLMGIDVIPPAVPGACDVKFYNNTIRLAGSGSATFGSTGFNLTSTAAIVDIRNNIVVNESTPGSSSGFATGLRMPSTYANWDVASNNNLWYTTQQSNTPLFVHNATPYVTLAAFQGAVGGRESLSRDLAVDFVNAGLNDLHIKPDNNCGLDGLAQTLTDVTDDIDGDVRNNPPKVGADEYENTGGAYGVWKGVNTNWDDPVNWCGGVPNFTTNVVIPASAPNYPVITSTNPKARNLTIDAGGNITINTGGMIAIKGNVANTGTIDNNGTILLNGTAAQTFPGTAGTITAMYNLEVSNPAGMVLNKPITISGALLPTSGTITLGNNNITLASSLAGTARIGTVGTTNAFVYNGTGRFEVQRYINTGTGVGQHGRSWQLLATPAFGQTINAAWQEGNVPLGNNTPGFGTIMTSHLPGATGLGFDVYTPAGSSMKIYNPVTNGYDGVPNTLSTEISNKKGYMILVRGPRSVQSTATAASPTVMRITGRVYAPGTDAPASTTVGANQFESVGNPYASAINPGAITRSASVQDVFYVWDPSINGAYGLGAWNTLLPSGGLYYPVLNTPYYPIATPVNIQSGQAFIVRAVGSAGTVSFTEAAKVAGFDTLLRPNNAAQEFKAYLFQNNAVLDGNSLTFDESFSNEMDMLDIHKFRNSAENFGINGPGAELMVESRIPVNRNDTIFYKLSGLRNLEYELRFAPENLATEAGLTAYLEDLFTGSSTIISLTDSTFYRFTVSSQDGSNAADRFRVVFKRIPPVKFISINATPYQQHEVKVDWSVEDEVNVSNYTVQHSVNGTDFLSIGSVNSLNAETSAYSSLHHDPVEGMNYYRIMSLSNNGEIRYSAIAEVRFKAPPVLITLYPNPVGENRMVNVNLSNMPAGRYNIVISSVSGKEVLRSVVEHSGRTAVYPLRINGLTTHGTYLVAITGPDRKRNIFKIVY